MNATATEPASQVEEIIEAIRKDRRSEPPEIAEYYAAWAHGGMGWKEAEAFGFLVAGAKAYCGPDAEALFDLHAAGRSSQYDKSARRAKDWAYKVAAEFVLAQRGVARIRGYSLDWGRQAARDGVFRAMWPDLSTPGRAPRATKFGCGERPYARVRDHVQAKAEKLIASFRDELAELHRQP